MMWLCRRCKFGPHRRPQILEDHSRAYAWIINNQMSTVYCAEVTVVETVQASVPL